MNIHEARWLTDLFNHKAPHCHLDMGRVLISMESAAGSTWTVNARTPIEIGRHLRFFRDTDLPELKRGTFDTKSQKGMPNPIILEGTGRFIDPETKLTWNEEQFVRFRFMDSDSPSELCLHGDFHREDRINPINKRPGPSLNQVITLMFSARNNWAKINFLPERRDTIRLVVT